jgi:hypothetical protein
MFVLAGFSGAISIVAALVIQPCDAWADSAGMQAIRPGSSI